MKRSSERFQRVGKILAVVLLAIGFSGRAKAQRFCAEGLTLHSLRSDDATVVAGKARVPKSDVAQATAPEAVVSGGGRAQLTDPDGDRFSHQFSISAVVNEDGSAHGQAQFVFPAPFAQKWGALPGVADLITLKTEVATGSVGGDGSVELNGPFVETDYNRTEGIVFQEDSRVTGITPWKVVIAPDAKTFALSWCAFIPPAGTGSFAAEVTSGKLNVR
jgi:hypothetical protein